MKTVKRPLKIMKEPDQQRKRVCTFKEEIWRKRINDPHCPGATLSPSRRQQLTIKL